MSVLLQCESLFIAMFTLVLHPSVIYVTCSVSLTALILDWSDLSLIYVWFLLHIFAELVCVHVYIYVYIYLYLYICKKKKVMIIIGELFTKKAT